MESADRDAYKSRVVLTVEVGFKVTLGRDIVTQSDMVW